MSDADDICNDYGGRMRLDRKVRRLSFYCLYQSYSRVHYLHYEPLQFANPTETITWAKNCHDIMLTINQTVKDDD